MKALRLFLREVYLVSCLKGEWRVVENRRHGVVVGSGGRGYNVGMEPEATAALYCGVGTADGTCGMDGGASRWSVLGTGIAPAEQCHERHQ